jgi:hypothetical protein
MSPANNVVPKAKQQVMVSKTIRRLPPYQDIHPTLPGIIGKYAPPLVGHGRGISSLVFWEKKICLI